MENGLQLLKKCGILTLLIGTLELKNINLGGNFMTLLINNKYTIVCCHIKSKHRMSILFLLLLSNQNSYKKASWHLTTVILYEPQVRELGPHVTLDAMETASKWSYLSWQLGGESCLLVAQRGRRVAAVHGDWRSLHWGNRKCKPKTEQLKKNSQKSLLKENMQENQMIRWSVLYLSMMSLSSSSLSSMLWMAPLTAWLSNQ